LFLKLFLIIVAAEIGPNKDIHILRLRRIIRQKKIDGHKDKKTNPETEEVRCTETEAAQLRNKEREIETKKQKFIEKYIKCETYNIIIETFE